MATMILAKKVIFNISRSSPLFPLNTLFKTFSGTKKCYKYKQSTQGVEKAISVTMATMILAKKVIFNISRSSPQTQSLFLRSSYSSTHKFSRATSFTASAIKEKTQEVKHKAAELKDIGRRSVADKAKQGSYKARESFARNVAGKTKDMAGKTNQEGSKEKEKHWKKPPEGWHVLSTDGSARKVISGIGGLIRDQNGSIVVAFAAGIPSNAPIPVIEIKAIVEGVKLAISIGVTKLIINSDSIQAVEVINGRLKAPPKARDDIILLNSMKGFFIGFEVRHVCRKANRPADFLASFCKNKISLVFNSVNTPEQLKVLADQDRM